MFGGLYKKIVILCNNKKTDIGYNGFFHYPRGVMERRIKYFRLRRRATVRFFTKGTWRTSKPERKDVYRTRIYVEKRLAVGPRPNYPLH